MAPGRRARNLARRKSRPYIKNFSYLIDHIWMGGRAVEGTGLENRQGLALLVGSNPTPSATLEGTAPSGTHFRDQISLVIAAMWGNIRARATYGPGVGEVYGLYT